MRIGSAQAPTPFGLIHTSALPPRDDEGCFCEPAMRRRLVACASQSGADASVGHHISYQKCIDVLSIEITGEEGERERLALVVRVGGPLPRPSVCVSVLVTKLPERVLCVLLIGFCF